jgi:hypothetical protein
MTVPKNQLNFRQICETSRNLAAESAWARAVLASGLRHLMLSQHRYAEASRFGEIKEAALKLVVSLVPDQVNVTIDDDYQVGLLSIRWIGHGQLHLGADCSI